MLKNAVSKQANQRMAYSSHFGGNMSFHCAWLAMSSISVVSDSDGRPALGLLLILIAGIKSHSTTVLKTSPLRSKPDVGYIRVQKACTRSFSFLLTRPNPTAERFPSKL
jgi:hypothetical protein